MPDVSDSPNVHHTPQHTGKVGNFLKQETAGLPNWAWLLVIAAGIAAAVIIPRFIKGGGGSGTDVSGNGLGLAIDPTTGLPYAVEGLVNTGGDIPPPNITGGDDNIDLNDIQDSLREIAKNLQDNTKNDDTKTDTKTDTTKDTTPKKTMQWETIQPITSGWGSGAPSIPIRETPGGKIVGHYGYGKRVTVTGNAVNGPNNFGANTPKGVGSTKWYPVKGGYVSAHDIEKVSGTGSVGPMWPNAYIRSRHHMVV